MRKDYRAHTAGILVLFLMFWTATSWANPFPEGIAGTLKQLELDGTSYPIEGAEIDLRYNDGLTVFDDVYRDTVRDDVYGNPLTRTTMTDKDGRFSFQVPKGTYDIPWIDLNHEKINRQSYGPIKVEDGKTTTYDIVLPAKNVIGTVIEEGTNQMVGSGRLHLIQQSPDGRYLKSYNFKVDSNGTFSGILPKGKYVIDGFRQDSSDQEWIRVGKIFEVTDTNQATEVEVTVPPIRLVGQLLFPSGQAMQPDDHANLSLVEVKSGSHFSISIESDGSFQKRLPLGNYTFSRLSIYHANTNHEEVFYIQDSSFSITEGMKAPLKKDIHIPKINVSGKVWEEGGTAIQASGSIYIESVDGTPYWDGNLSIRSDGSFQAAFPSGEYIVRHLHLNYENGSYESIQLNQKFSVSNSLDPIPVQILIPKINLIGSIHFSDGRTIGARDQMYLSLRSENGIYTSIDIKDDGSFTKRLFSGRYTVEEVTVYNYETSQRDVYYLNEPTFTIEEGMTEPLKQQLMIRTTPSIEGKISRLDLEGREIPIPDAMLEFVRVEQSVTSSVYGGGGGFFQSYRTETNANGDYRITLPDGAYRLTSIWDHGNQLMDREVGTISVQYPNKAIYNLVLPAYNVTGSVMEAGSFAKTGPGMVYIKQKDSGEIHRLRIDSSGNFTGHFPVGDYVVEQIYLDAIYGGESELIRINQSFTVQNPSEMLTIEISIPAVTLKGNILFSDHRSINPNDRYTLVLVDLLAANPKSYHLPINRYGEFSGRLPKGWYRIGEVIQYERETGQQNIYYLSEQTVYIPNNLAAPIERQIVIHPTLSSSDLNGDQAVDIIDIVSAGKMGTEVLKRVIPNYGVHHK